MTRGGYSQLLAVTLLAVSGWSTAAAQRAESAAADAAARTAVADCASRISDAPTGLAQVEKRCPDLPAALQAAGIGSLIIASSRDQFDRGSLLQLQKLLRPTSTAGPNVAQLDAILRGLHPQVVAPRSWWRRVWDWIVQHLTGRQSQSSDSWWSELVRQMIGARWLWIALIGCVLVAIVVAVVVLVVREVRARGGRAGTAAAPAGIAAGGGPEDSRLALLRQAPLGQRPAQLFAMLISRLVAAGRLPADRSLTHREVARSARLDDPEQRRFIESLARLSEWQLYSAASSAPEGIEEVLARGEDLYTVGWGRPSGG